MKPAYKFDDFVKDCSLGLARVYIIKGAVETARLHFNLKTEKSILNFIANDGLEIPHFINSKIWEKNPDKENTLIMTDAYGFYSGEKYGYISFMLQPKTEKWTIKSFKYNIQPDTRNRVFKDLKLLTSSSSEELT